MDESKNPPWNDEFLEDEEPSEDSDPVVYTLDISEDETALPNTPELNAATSAPAPPSHRESVQENLGTIIISTALIGYLFVLGFWLLLLVLGVPEAVEGMRDIVTYIVAGLQTLAAAVVGFYFGSEKH